MLAATARQLQILGFIANEIAFRGVAPSQREIGVRFGIASTNGVREHLWRLKKKALLEVFYDLTPGERHGLSRAIVVTAEGWKALGREPLAPPPRKESTARIVNVNTGWRCAICRARREAA